MKRPPRRLLLVAFHFPPLLGSSGMQRAIAFGRYLPEFGWRVTVLTAHERAFAETAAANQELVPDAIEVMRAQAWDAARHMAVLGRYPDWLARPDRWRSWVPFAIRAGLREHRRDPFDVVMSTFPIASAHLIGEALHHRCRIPWVAEFRDPMATRSYPFEQRLRRIWTGIQDRAVAGSRRVVVTTPGAARFYRDAYPAQASDKFVVIANGFEPELLSVAATPSAAPRRAGPLLLLHSGMLYPRERDPEPFLRSLNSLRRRGVLDPERLQVRLRASGYDDRFASMIASHGLDDMVELAPGIPHADALAEMASADALLLFQARVCNDQIPAKAYEYLYAGRPIIAIADPAGDTGQLMREYGVPGIAALEDEGQICAMLESQLPRIADGSYPVPPRERVMGLSRRSGARDLARLLDALSSDPGSPGSADSARA